MPQDYYEVLGIRRDAAPEEVRGAYRRLAKAHHPDLNHDDPDADVRFKAINEAYEVLRDPDKRAAYDRFGHAGVRGAGGGARGGPAPGYGDFGDLGDIFEQFFGFGARGRTRQASRVERGSDLRTRLRLTFEEAVFGVTRRVAVTRYEACETCDGSGASAGSRAAACQTCQGSGQVRRTQQTVFGSFVNVQTCPTCRGEGEVIHDPCATCEGQGRARKSRKLDVDIPAGVDDGLQIRLASEGNHGRFGGPPGDLFVVLDVSPHPNFVRDGNELHMQLRLNAADAALGSEVEVPTLEGTTVLRVPSGTQTGDTFRLPGLGVPHLRRSGRGDMVVTVFVATPEKLSRTQRELLEQLRDTLPDAEVVERRKGGFWNRVRERFT